MTDPHLREFKTYDPDGILIASGAAPREAFAPLPDSAVRAAAEQLLEDAAVAIGLIEQQEQHAEQLRERQLRTVIDGIAAIGKRLDAVDAHRAERDRQAAVDEARALQQRLDAMPDPDAPGPAIYHPSGDLHAVAASAPQDRARSRAAQDQGALPAELTHKVAPAPGSDPVADPAELAHPQPQSPTEPVAVSLDEG